MRSYALGFLAVGQGFYLSAMSVDLTVTALAGALISPSPMLATLPMALISIGSVLVAPVVSRFMSKIGAKRMFLVGALIAAAGGISSYFPRGAAALRHYVRAIFYVILLCFSHGPP